MKAWIGSALCRAIPDDQLSFEGEEPIDLDDLILTDLPKLVFAELPEQAQQADLSTKAYATTVICEVAAKLWHRQDDDISTSQLQTNLDAIVKNAEREPVFISTKLGDRFVLMSAERFLRLDAGTEQAT